MKKYLFFLSFFLLTACGQGPGTVYLNRALRRPVPLQELCSGRDSIPLRVPAGTVFEWPDQADLAVSGNYFFLPDRTGRKIGVFDREGGFVSQLAFEDPVVGFSVWQDRYLDVLTGNSLSVRPLDSLSRETVYPLMTEGITLTDMMRQREGVFYFKGNREGKAYDCFFFVDKDWFGSMEAGYCAPGGMFFRAEDTLHYCSPEGRMFVYSSDDFIFPGYVWKVKGKVPEVSRAQMTQKNRYLAFTLGGVPCLFVQRRSDGRYVALHHTAEGDPFPLGTIYDSVNYCYFPPSGAEGPVLMKYTLL